MTAAEVQIGIKANTEQFVKSMEALRILCSQMGFAIENYLLAIGELAEGDDD